MRIPYAILIIACLMTSCAPTRRLQEAPLRAQVQQSLYTILDTYDIPGVNFSVILPNGNREDYAVGYEDVTNKIKLQTDRLMLSGSTGKTYAVALLMKLVEQGKVDLKDRIKDYFPEVTWLNRLPNIDEITIEMLLQHTSGLPRWVLKEAVWEKLGEDPNLVWSYEDRLAYVFDEDPVHQAGAGWAYSDTNYILIGMLIEKLTGKAYYSLVERKLLRPNGLKGTAPSNQRNIPRLAVAYSELPASFNLPEVVVSNGQYAFNPQVEWTGGGMASTTADLATWCKLYYEAKLFAPALVKQITTINPNGKQVYGERHSYGMGSFIYQTDHGIAYGHSGFMPGYISIMVYYPDSQIAAALQFNADYAANEQSLVGYLNQLMTHYQED